MNSIRQVEVRLSGQIVGRIALNRSGLCAFEYDSQWLHSGFSISPFELPLREGVFIAKSSPFDGGFGVFDDSLPDGWGLIVMERYLQSKGINPANLTILDRLSYVGNLGRGALEYIPNQALMNNSDVVDFEHLSNEIEKILASDDYKGLAIEELYRKGGSPGGKRPKIFVKYAEKEWLVKFRASSDKKDIGKEEYQYSLLAKECGIEMPQTKLFEEKYFGVQRFDRHDDKKFHVVSAAGLLRADYRIPSLDYNNLFSLCKALTHSEYEMWKLYKLMVFNYLIKNKDDHAKNFAFIYKDDDWHLTPAYDILPSSGMNGYHTTSFNDSIVPKEHDVFAVAAKAGLDVNVAKKVFEEMQKMVGI